MLENPVTLANWNLIRKLGSGGFGTVNLWRNKKTKQFVAIKQCHPQLTLNDNDETKKQRERWEKEVDFMTNKINNENIVKVVKVDPEFFCELTKTNASKLPILIMEYCEGGDLRTLLSDISNIYGLHENDVRSVLKCLKNSISYLHSLGITHRDIKPENIVRHTINYKTIYKLTDLGLAKELDQKTVQASLVGTIGYVAPELFCSDCYTRTVDYWSMGIISFEIICGVRPFVPHCSFPTFISQIKQKKSEHIAITEANIKNTFNFHNKLFEENRLSNKFKELLEKWLILPLEKNPKQRGCRFEMNMGAPDEVPRNIPRIFPELDEVLNTKILTIFSLSTYEYLSYDANSLLNMNDLLELIEIDTKIPVDQIKIIIPPEQKLESIIDTKPIDLYIEDLDTPMLYITSFTKLLKFEDIKPKMPKIIEDVLGNPTIVLEPWCLAYFIRSSLCLMQREDMLFKTYLKGLRDYAEYINHIIISYKAFITNIHERSHTLIGKMNMHVISLHHISGQLTQKKLEDNNKDVIANWEVNCGRIENRIKQLHLANTTIFKRYESVVRRSSEIVENPLLKQESHNFDLDPICQEILKTQKEQKKLCKIVYEFLKKRDKLLNSKALDDLQKQISEVHVEFHIIENQISSVASEQLVKFDNEISDIHKMYIDELLKMNEKLAIEQYNMEKPTLPDFDVLRMESNSINSVNSAMSLGSGQRSLELSFLGEPNDTKSLIEESKSLREVTQDYLQDIEMKLSAERSLRY